MRPMTAALAILATGLAFPAAAAERPRPEPRPDAVAATACLAEAVYFEARGTSRESRAAVAHVVLNRADDPAFPDTPCAVVTEDCQFSYRCDGRSDRMADPSDRAEAYRTAARALAGASSDPTGGALFFHAARIDAAWHATRDRTAQVGPHVFYR